VGRLIDRLTEETRALQAELDSEVEQLLVTSTADTYRRYLTRMYGFVSPLERSLADTAGLSDVVDTRRLRKHLLLEHDLHTLQVRDLNALPQCMSIPWFDSVHQALGWCYLVERSTLAHPNLFRHLAAEIPGEVAFASSYLKCYFGAVGEMWRSFGEDLEAATKIPHDEDRVIDAAKAAFRHYRRWRATLEGKALSMPRPKTEESPRG
jgi:heme oxygenase